MIEYHFPNYPDISEISIAAEDRDYLLDLRPYVDASAYTIRETASVQRAYRMFRTLGLRHLCVTDKRNNILGIVTRADFISSHVDRCMNRGSKNNRKMIEELNSLFQEEDEDDL